MSGTYGAWPLEDRLTVLHNYLEDNDRVVGTIPTHARYSVLDAAEEIKHLRSELEWFKREIKRLSDLCFNKDHEE